MTPADRQAVATLAAAIVTSRGAKGATELQSAWTDASWIVFPDAANPDYRTWQEKHQRVASNTRTPSRPVHMNMGGKHIGFS